MISKRECNDCSQEYDLSLINHLWLCPDHIIALYERTEARAAAAEANATRLSNQVSVLARRVDELMAQVGKYHRTLTVISATVAGLERKPQSVIARDVKTIQGWIDEALK